MLEKEFAERCKNTLRDMVAEGYAYSRNEEKNKDGRLRPNGWRVFSGGKWKYTVKREGGDSKLRCSCQGFKYGGANACKHIRVALILGDDCECGGVHVGGYYYRDVGQIHKPEYRYKCNTCGLESWQGMQVDDDSAYT
tara:strand:+ start:791 stop:1204 length:414 start_codon:yes stop_codon:yes gene_type:complete